MVTAEWGQYEDDVIKVTLEEAKEQNEDQSGCGC